MFSLTKQVLILLLRFSCPLAHVPKVSDRTKCLSLDDEPSMVKPTLIDLNPVELKYYPFMIILDKCNGCCNVILPKICVPKEKKDINVKVFNMITKLKTKLKKMAKHIPCCCK